MKDNFLLFWKKRSLQTTKKWKFDAFDGFDLQIFKAKRKDWSENEASYARNKVLFHTLIEFIKRNFVKKLSFCNQKIHTKIAKLGNFGWSNFPSKERKKPDVWCNFLKWMDSVVMNKNQFE